MSPSASATFARFLDSSPRLHSPSPYKSLGTHHSTDSKQEPPLHQYSSIHTLEAADVTQIERTHSSNQPSQSIRRSSSSPAAAVVEAKMAYLRVKHRDEEGKVVKEKVPIPETRRPETAKYFERKLEEQGFHRFERHPVNAPRGVGIGTPPPKSGHGGKYTWEGPGGLVENVLDPAPPAIDPKDPNYEEEEGGGEDEVAKEVVVGEVEVAKVAEARDGVARVDVVPPLLQEQEQQKQ